MVAVLADIAEVEDIELMAYPLHKSSRVDDSPRNPIRGLTFLFSNHYNDLGKWEVEATDPYGKTSRNSGSSLITKSVEEELFNIAS